MTTQGPLADCFTEDELAAEAKLSKRTLARYRNEPNGLPFFRLGGRVYIRCGDWREYLERRIVRPNPTRAAMREAS